MYALFSKRLLTFVHLTFVPMNRRQGPAVPPRLATPDQVLADRPQPPLPPTANQRLVHPGGNSDGDDDDSSDDDNGM